MRPAALFVVCFVFWLLLSGHFAVLEVSLGVLAAALVTYLCRDLELVTEALRPGPRLLGYIPWLLKEIVIANLQVVRVVLHPRLPINPVVGRIRVPFASDLAIATLGNSITLTPGTVTVDAEGGELTIHSLLGPDPIKACEGPMARRVARVFGESPP